jgi:chromosome segregation protein
LARADALRGAARDAGEGAVALVAAAAVGKLSGVRGRLIDHVDVVDGMATAVAAALGPLGQAVVVSSRAAARAAVDHARTHGSGRVLVLVSGTGPPPATPDGVPRREARPLLDAVRGDAGVVSALASALRGVYGVEDFATACRLSARFPEYVFVTTDGDLAGGWAYEGGSDEAAGPVVWLARAAAEEAELAVIDRELADARGAVRAAERDTREATGTVERVRAELRDRESRSRIAAESASRVGGELARCRAEQRLLSSEAEQLAAEVERQRAQRDRLTRDGEGPEDPAADLAEVGPSETDEQAQPLDERLAAAREAEVAARMALVALESRGAELSRQAAALERDAAAAEHAQQEREQRRRRRLAAVERCVALAALADASVRQAEASLAAAGADHDRLEQATGHAQQELGAIRAELGGVEAQLVGALDRTHDDELRLGQVDAALEALRRRIRDDLGADPDDLLAQPADGSGDDDDAALADEENRLARMLGLLGAVNPLAVEEHRALQERARFLAAQLDDLRASRRDLLEVVAAVDARIVTVFEAAFRDVSAQFERVFGRLFPGGEGRLVLSDPDDLLDSGVEVEARPAGKRVKRLSLLSGGERALAALALLLAIFAARPSPFCVLDEVEAALDDVNLQRFLELVRDLRSGSQVLLITHQQRTMEIADCLYGVSMQPEGVTKVVSQRLSDRAD